MLVSLHFPSLSSVYLFVVQVCQLYRNFPILWNFAGFKLLKHEKRKFQEKITAKNLKKIIFWLKKLVFPFQIVQMFPAYYIFNVLLSTLLILHVIWTYYILKILCQALLSGRVSRSWSPRASPVATTLGIITFSIECNYAEYRVVLFLSYVNCSSFCITNKRLLQKMHFCS